MRAKSIDADFRDASFTAASRQGADLSHARNLTQQQQVAEACSDSHTRPPPQLTPHICGEK